MENVNVKQKKHLSNKHREWLSGYAFISLWLIGLLVFTLFPVAQAFWYSLNEAKFYGGSIRTTFQWFKNFSYAFTGDINFPKILTNYLIEIIVDVPFSIVASLILAMLLNQNIKGKSFFRVIFFLPVIISTGPVISELMGQGATSIQLLSSDFVKDILTNYLP